MTALTVREHMTLKIAGRPYRDRALYVAPARVELGYSEPRFWAVVGALLERPEAEAAYPQLVHRLRRVRDAGREARSRRVA